MGSCDNNDGIFSEASSLESLEFTRRGIPVESILLDVKDDRPRRILQYCLSSQVFTSDCGALTFIRYVLKHSKVLSSGKATVKLVAIQFTLGYFFQQYFERLF